MQKRSFGYALALSALLTGALGSAALADRVRDFHARGAGLMAGGFVFDEADTDKDGKVTADELRAWRAARIEGLDANGDGRIDADELVAHEMKQAEARARARAGAMLERLDLDGDGALSAAELMVGPAPGMAMFERLDTDGDGAVSKAELDQAQARLGRRDGGDDRHPGHGERRGPGHERGHERGHEGGKPGHKPGPDAPPAGDN